MILLYFLIIYIHITYTIIIVYSLNHNMTNNKIVEDVIDDNVYFTDKIVEDVIDDNVYFTNKIVEDVIDDNVYFTNKIVEDVIDDNITNNIYYNNFFIIINNYTFNTTYNKIETTNNIIEYIIRYLAFDFNF